MGTMNFSIPDAVKEAFNEAFADENKSAIVAELMRQAVVEKERRATEKAALSQLIETVLGQCEADEPVTAEAISSAREEGRP